VVILCISGIKLIKSFFSILVLFPSPGTAQTRGNSYFIACFGRRLFISYWRGRASSCQCESNFKSLYCLSKERQIICTIVHSSCLEVDYTVEEGIISAVTRQPEILLLRVIAHIRHSRKNNINRYHLDRVYSNEPQTTIPEPTLRNTNTTATTQSSPLFICLSVSRMCKELYQRWKGCDCWGLLKVDICAGLFKTCFGPSGEKDKLGTSRPWHNPSTL
jgi:hypothetical protein